MKIIAYHVQPYEVEAFKEWSRENDIEVVLKEELLTEETVEWAKGFDGISTQQVIPVKSEAIFKKIEEFGITQLSTRTAGVDMFDGELAKKHGVHITNVPRYSGNAIAELALSHAMYLLRNMGKIQHAQDECDFRWNKDYIAREVRNCTVGIVGTGYIGFTAARLFHGLGAKVIGFDKIHNENAKGILEYRDSLEELLKESDIVSLHLPLFEENIHMINKDNLKLMKNDAILINTGRGGLIKTDDLIEALENGTIGAAGLDVLESETLYVNQIVDKKKIEGSHIEKLRSMHNTIVSGHFAFFTKNAVADLVSISCNNIKTYLETGKEVNRTNK